MLVFSSFFLAFGKFIMLHVVTNLRRHAEIHTVKIGEYDGWPSFRGTNNS